MRRTLSMNSVYESIAQTHKKRGLCWLSGDISTLDGDTSPRPLFNDLDHFSTINYASLGKPNGLSGTRIQIRLPIVI